MFASCPVCSHQVSDLDLEAHVQAHFANDEGPDLVKCNHPGCGCNVPILEIDSHEASHTPVCDGAGRPQASKRSGSSLASRHDLTREVWVISDDDCSPAAPPEPRASFSDGWPRASAALPSAAQTASAAVASSAAAAAAAVAAATSISTAQACSHAAAPAPSALVGPTAAPVSNTSVACSSRDCVFCPLGCKQWIPLCDMDSHELQHQLTAADADTGAAQQRPPLQQLRWPDGAAQRHRRSSGSRRRRRSGSCRSSSGSQLPRCAAPQRPGTCLSCGLEGHWARECPTNPRAVTARQAQPPLPRDPAQLVMGQRPESASSGSSSSSKRVHGLLVECLEGAQEGPGYSAFLCAPMEHHCGHAHDRGWGCGWRNMQMMVSSLLSRPSALPGLLFGGAGFVPDIASLQAWLEVAWGSGFDTAGCDSLGGGVQGSTKWVGTTEASSLLSYFGARPAIVDFVGKQAPHRSSAVLLPDGRVSHTGVQCDVCGIVPIIGVRHRSTSRADFDLCGVCVECTAAEASRPSPVHVTGLPPLYFQHAGHSRTIVGIERRRASVTGQATFTILVFDPSEDTSHLESVLRQRRQWQKHVRRGLHTLTHGQYQLMYVREGVATEPERQDSKVIRAVEVVRRSAS
ncbi:MAG: hypothetical protein WDW38_007777 [Sanguina aurantia]